MPVKWRVFLLLVFLSVVLPAASSLCAVGAARRAKPAPAANDEPREIVRVGVIYYDDFQKKAKDFQEVISTLTKNSKRRFDFRLVIGTYDEVLDWYQKNLIDVAVMTPGTVAELIRNSPDEAARLQSLYIGTRGIKPSAESHEGLHGKGAPQHRYEYHSVALVNQTAPVSSVEGLKSLYDRGEVEFLFVHQLSASGYILPRHALHQSEMKLDAPERNRVRLTYSHDESLRQLVPSRCLVQEPDRKPPEHIEDGVKNRDGRIKVAFVTDETDYPVISEKMKNVPACNLKKVSFPALDDNSIPQDVVLLSTEFDEKLKRGTPAGKDARADIERLLTTLGKLGEKGDKDFIVKSQPDKMNSIQKVIRWIGTFVSTDKKSPNYNQLSSQAYTVEQIITRLNNYDRQNPDKLRLALVLSGGGAKCAYQLGAIEALENELEKNSRSGRPNVDIALVVGTSGGAINALPVALGLTRGEEQEKLRHVWRDLTLSEFISPRNWISSGWGLCLGLLQAVALMRLALLLYHLRKSRFKGRFWKEQNWWLPVSLCMILLGLIETAVFWFEWYPFHFIRPLDRDHNLFHLWSLLLPTLFWAAVTLVTIGLLFLLIGVDLSLTRPRAAGSDDGDALPAEAVAGGGAAAAAGAPAKWLAAIIARQRAQAGMFYDNLARAGGGAARLYLWRRPLVFWTFMVALLACLLQAYTTVMRVGSFSESAGVEKAMIKAFPYFLERQEIKRKERGDNSEQLEHLSRQIVGKRPLWKRDLVITASRLPDTEDDARSRSARAAERGPDDMYFYFDATPTPTPPAAPTPTPAAGATPTPPPPVPEIPPLDKRFISFTDGSNDRLLLDVVIGSSSIFPLYPARPLKTVNVGTPGRTPDMEIIDGGFVHNSPIEAALLWDATHIIVIEATPDEEPSKEKNLLSNIMAAFNYLYTQSQTIDTRSRGKVEIFTLRPELARADEDPNACLLDFSKRLVNAAIHKGYNDAMNVAEPRFRREPGQPLY